MINIKGIRNKEKIRGIIDLYFQDWNLEIDEEPRYGKFDILIRVKNEHTREEFLRVLSDAIEEVMMSECLDDAIKTRARRIYKGEYLRLDKYVIDKIKEEIQTSHIYLDEKIKMKEELVSYLEESQAIDIDGYMKFRLNDYIYILDVAIDNIITEIEEEKKIKEFIEMVKYVIQTHPSSANILNLIIRDGNFCFRDINNNAVGSDIINKVEEEFDAKTVTKSDILLSSLILISPKRLILHGDLKEESFLMKAIKEIFGDRLVICNGCNICRLD